MHLTLLDVNQANKELFLPYTASKPLEFHRISSPQTADSKSLVFASDLKDYLLAYEKGCRNFVLATKFERNPNLKADAEHLFARHLTLALSKTQEHFFPDKHEKYLSSGISKTAIVDSTSTIGKGVRIGPNVVVGPNCKIAENVSIGANTIIEGDVEIGEGSFIDALVFVGRRTLIGRHCMIKPHCSIGGVGFGFATDEKRNSYRIPQVGRVVLEDRVELGAGCQIDRAAFDETRIGEGSKFDNLCHIAHNTKIGKNGLFAGRFSTAGSVTIGDNFMCGGRVSVTDHITVCDNVQVAGLSGISNDITQPGAYGGYPLQPLKEHLKSTASIAVLPQLRKDIARIIRHLGLNDSEGDK